MYGISLGLLALTLGSGGPIAKEVVDREKDGQYIYQEHCCYQNEYLSVDIWAFRSKFILVGIGAQSTVYSKSDSPDSRGEELGEESQVTVGLGLCGCGTILIPHVSVKSDFNGGYTMSLGVRGFHASKVLTKFKGMEHQAYAVGFSLPI